MTAPILACQTIAAKTATRWPDHIRHRENVTIRANIATARMWWHDPQRPSVEERVRVWLGAIEDVVAATDRVAS